MRARGARLKKSGAAGHHNSYLLSHHSYLNQRRQQFESKSDPSHPGVPAGAGVDTVFGYPGGTILNLYDELYNYQTRFTTF